MRATLKTIAAAALAVSSLGLSAHASADSFSVILIDGYYGNPGYRVHHHDGAARYRLSNRNPHHKYHYHRDRHDAHRHSHWPRAQHSQRGDDHRRHDSHSAHRDRYDGGRDHDRHVRRDHRDDPKGRHGRDKYARR